MSQERMGATVGVGDVFNNYFLQKLEFSAKSPIIHNWDHHDFQLFPQTQDILQEWRLTTEDVQRNVTKSSKTISQDEFQHQGWSVLRARWHQRTAGSRGVWTLKSVFNQNSSGIFFLKTS